MAIIFPRFFIHLVNKLGKNQERIAYNRKQNRDQIFKKREELAKQWVEKYG